MTFSLKAPGVIFWSVSDFSYVVRGGKWSIEKLSLRIDSMVLDYLLGYRDYPATFPCGFRTYNQQTVGTLVQSIATHVIP